MSAANIAGERFGELTALRPLERRQHGIAWTCICDCGRHAVRTVATLRGSIKRGRKPCCHECLKELRSGIFASRRKDTHAFWVEFFQKYGHLYTAYDEPWLYGDGGPTVPMDETPNWRESGRATAWAMPDGMTLEEVGEQLGITRERVRQIEAKALRKLRHPTRSKLLLSFVGGPEYWETTGELADAAIARASLEEKRRKERETREAELRAAEDAERRRKTWNEKHPYPTLDSWRTAQRATPPKRTEALPESVPPYRSRHFAMMFLGLARLSGDY